MTNINDAVRFLNYARAHLELEARKHDDEDVQGLLSDLAEDIGTILVKLETEFGVPPEAVGKEVDEYLRVHIWPRAAK